MTAEVSRDLSSPTPDDLASLKKFLTEEHRYNGDVGDQEMAPPKQIWRRISEGGSKRSWSDLLELNGL
jgi:hypothetical protein